MGGRWWRPLSRFLSGISALIRMASFTPPPRPPLKPPVVVGEDGDVLARETVALLFHVIAYWRCIAMVVRHSLLQASLCLADVFGGTVFALDLVYDPRAIELLCSVFGGDEHAPDGVGGSDMDTDASFSYLSGDSLGCAASIRDGNVSFDVVVSSSDINYVF